MLYQLSYASLTSPETGLTPELSGRTYSRRVHGTELKISTGPGAGQTVAALFNLQFLRRWESNQ